MQEQKTIVNPYFQRFLDRSNLYFQYLNLFFGCILVLCYFAGFAFMTKMGIVTSVTLVVFIVFTFVVIKKIDILKLLVNVFIAFDLMIIVTLLILYVTKSEHFIDMLFPGLKGIVLGDIVYVLSTVEFLTLTTSFLLGLFAVVWDVFNMTITSVKVYSGLKSEKIKNTVKQVVFGVFIIIAVILVYAFLGEELLNYANSLLEDIGSVQILFLLIPVGYYCKVLFKGSSVVNGLDKLCCK